MDYRITGKSQSTLKTYSGVIDLFLRHLGDEELSPKAIKEYLAHVSANSKMTTVSNYCRTLRTSCHFLVREGYAEEDPMADIRKPKVHGQFPFVLSDEDLS